jgi:hypothetical protein
MYTSNDLRTLHLSKRRIKWKTESTEQATYYRHDLAFVCLRGMGGSFRDGNGKLALGMASCWNGIELSVAHCYAAHEDEMMGRGFMLMIAPS